MRTIEETAAYMKERYGDEALDWAVHAMLRTYPPNLYWKEVARKLGYKEPTYDSERR
jgi:hypothetical protein